MAQSVRHFYTTLTNLSGTTRFFGGIGPHGVRLAANESIAVPGSLLDRLTAGKSTRVFAALARAVVAGRLGIVSTPSQVFYDATNDASYVLVLDGGVLSPLAIEESSSSVAE